MDIIPASEREISLQELKQLMLLIMQDIDLFCRSHNIRYFLAYGTLLGAVRHKGYIPWDDDIDIWMPRPDYMRFMKQYRHRYYSAYSAEFTPGWDHYIAKVCDDRTIIDEGHGDKCGVYIDVFPLDGLPDNPQRIQSHFRVIEKYLRIWSSLHYTRRLKIQKVNGVAKNIKILASRALGLFYSSNKALDKLQQVKMKYPYDKSRFVGYVGRWFIPRNNITSLIDADFENNRFLIPENYAEWLTTIYGDYMKLPPIEKRVSNHGFKAYWKSALKD